MTTAIIESPTGSGKTVWPACMGTDGTTPSDYGLDHATWRPGQAETLDWLKRTGMSGSVIALCRTKNLQAENYEATYGFDVLYGKANYPCVHSQAPGGATAGDCRHQDNMYQCKASTRCEYLTQKDICQQSPMVALNYAYYTAARWPRQHPPSVLFCDEAHQLPSIVLDKAGTTIKHKEWVDWNAWAMRWNAGHPSDKLAFIPTFPELKPGDGGGMFGGGSNPINEAEEWLVAARLSLRQIWLRLARIAVSKADLKLKRDCENLGRKLTATINALSACPDDWWIKSGQRAQKFKGAFRPAFVCRPLTARHHAPGYFGFDNGSNRVLMSATIGDFPTFAARLGIQHYQSRTVPNQWPASSRPIVALDCPPMGAASVRKHPRYPDMQARAVGELLKEYPGELGLLHTTSKWKARNLAKLLGANGLQDRVWVTPEVGTDKQMAAWHRAKQSRPGLVAIAWSWWEGVDVGDVRVNVVTQIPWAYLGDSYQMAKMKHDRAAFDQDAAHAVEQGTGRNRRGEVQHYFTNGNQGNVVALADGNWQRLEKFYSESFRESVVSV